MHVQVILPETLKGRLWYTSVVIHSSPKIRVICFGGIDTWPEDNVADNAVPIALTTIVELCKYSIALRDVQCPINIIPWLPFGYV